MTVEHRVQALALAVAVSIACGGSAWRVVIENSPAAWVNCAVGVRQLATHQQKSHFAALYKVT